MSVSIWQTFGQVVYVPFLCVTVLAQVHRRWTPRKFWWLLEQWLLWFRCLSDIQQATSKHSRHTRSLHCISK